LATSNYDRVGDVTGVVNVTMSFSNSWWWDTPTFSVDFTWWISSYPGFADPMTEYCGTGNIGPIKVPSRDIKRSTLILVFSAKNITRGLWDAVQHREFYIILEGTGHAKIFFDAIPVSKDFREIKSVSDVLP